jgi:L-iditol 2-dehydrogenase
MYEVQLCVAPHGKGSTMKVAMYHNNHKVTIEDQPIPQPKTREILVKTKACGVCVSDTMEWYLTPRAPLPRGHEVTGVVEKIGSEVNGFEVGDRIVSHHHVPCFTCDQCLRGDYTLCQKYKNSNIIPGGFSEYFIIPEDNVRFDTLRLPDSVSYEVGTLVEPLACVIHAIHKASIKHTDRVLLSGTGLMGMLFIKALINLGVNDLIVYEILEWRREKAQESGANYVYSPFSDTQEEKNRIKLTFRGKEATKVIVATKDL